MKKGDVVLIISVLLVALCSFIAIFFVKKEGKTIVVKENNKIVYEGSIIEDKTINLDGNTVVIEKSAVYMKNATCKNQICVHHKKISSKGETIVCLPHKVIVEIK